MPTETKALFPNKPKILNKKKIIQDPPPTAIEYFDLLKKAEAPKHIPVNANIDKNEAMQNKIVLSGTMFPASGLFESLIALAIVSDNNAKPVITIYITVSDASIKRYCVLTTVFLLVGVDKT